jgi:hypothetical protein
VKGEHDGSATLQDGIDNRAHGGDVDGLLGAGLVEDAIVAELVYAEAVAAAGGSQRPLAFLAARLR